MRYRRENIHSVRNINAESGMRKTIIVIIAFLSLLSGAEARKYPYQDPDLPVEKRVEDLISRMTIEEKVNQMSAQLLFMHEFYEKRDYCN